MRTVLLAFFLFTVQDMSAKSHRSRQGEAIKMMNGFPVVRTFINGQGPFRMLIDTGSARCAVRRSVAIQAGLVPHRQVLLSTMLNQKLVGVATAAVRVASIDSEETEVVINDLPDLDGFEPHIDGLLGQSFLANGSYLIDYRARRLWLGDIAAAKAQRLGPPIQVEFSSKRPVFPVEIDSKAAPVRLILDSGVDHLVLRCAHRCGTLLDEHSVRAVTNAGEMLVQKGRLPVAAVFSKKFFRMEAVSLRKPADPNNAEGSLPLGWLSAIYVDPVQRVVRIPR
ncbi:MAG: retropepsin-like aspartic protease [Bryobacteraceae bacterium]